MVLADTLSRAYLTDMEEELECYVHAVTSRIPVSEEKLEEIKKEIYKAIRRWWQRWAGDDQKTRKETPSEIQDFWNYRDELSEANLYFV